MTSPEAHCLQFRQTFVSDSEILVTVGAGICHQVSIPFRRSLSISDALILHSNSTLPRTTLGRCTSSLFWFQQRRSCGSMNRKATKKPEEAAGEEVLRVPIELSMTLNNGGRREIVSYSAPCTTSYSRVLSSLTKLPIFESTPRLQTTPQGH